MFLPRRFIRPGTTIISDFWKAYDCIPDVPGANYKHEKANDSKEFVCPDGVHTNNIEATWGSLKSKTPKRFRNKNYLQDHLFELMWRNQNEHVMWEALLEALRGVRYLPQELDAEMEEIDD